MKKEVLSPHENCELHEMIFDDLAFLNKKQLFGMSQNDILIEWKRITSLIAKYYDYVEKLKREMTTLSRYERGLDANRKDYLILVGQAHKKIELTREYKVYYERIYDDLLRYRDRLDRRLALPEFMQRIIDLLRFGSDRAK